MTIFSMLLGFAMLIAGGYGFASTKVASLSIPLMQKIEPTVHSWAFLSPLLCGLILFAYVVLNASRAHSVKALQVALALLLVLLLVNAPDLYFTVHAFSISSRPSLESLLRAESAIAAILFLVFGGMRLRRLTKTVQDSPKPSVSRSVSDPQPQSN